MKKGISSAINVNKKLGLWRKGVFPQEIHMEYDINPLKCSMVPNFQVCLLVRPCPAVRQLGTYVRMNQGICEREQKQNYRCEVMFT